MNRATAIAAGVIVFAACTSAQSGHGARAQTVDESMMFGVFTTRPASPPTCSIVIRNYYHHGKLMVYVGGTPSCTKAEIKNFEERWVRAVRERFGDPGRH